MANATLGGKKCLLHKTAKMDLTRFAVKVFESSYFQLQTFSSQYKKVLTINALVLYHTKLVSTVEAQNLK